MSEDPPCPDCCGLGYVRTQPAYPGEITVWPPACEPLGPWRRCTACGVADEVDEVMGRAEPKEQAK